MLFSTVGALLESTISYFSVAAAVPKMGESHVIGLRLEGRLGDSRIVPLSEWPIRMAHPREHHPLLTSEVH